MERDAIERHDFPVGRRGYDPGAVDAHLRAVADAMESLRVRAEASPRGLSSGTSEHVREILEAAERSAAGLREQAGEEAGAHVARVQEATGRMLERLDALQSELDGLLEALRRSGAALEDGLERLRAEVSGTAGEPVAPEPAVAPAIDEPADPAAIAAALEEEPRTVDGPGDEAGARLTALNMALNGAPREETAAFLAEHYDLADAEALLDDVYKRAGA